MTITQMEDFKIKKQQTEAKLLALKYKLLATYLLWLGKSQEDKEIKQYINIANAALSKVSIKLGKIAKGESYDKETKE